MRCSFHWYRIIYKQFFIVTSVGFLALPLAAQTTLLSEDFDDFCICDTSTYILKGWSIDDGTTTGYDPGKTQGSIVSGSLPFRQGLGVYSCVLRTGPYQLGGTNYSGFDGNWLNITSHPAGVDNLRFSDTTCILSPLIYIDDCRYESVRLELNWQLVGEPGNGQFRIDIWTGGLNGNWVNNIFSASGNSDSNMDSSSPNMTSNECNGNNYNGTLSDPDRLDITCFTGFYSGPMRFRLCYISDQPNGGLGIDNFKITAVEKASECHPDYDELVSLYAFTEGAQWTDKTGWQDGYMCQDCNVCQWAGVTCENNRVTRVELPFNNLKGVIPDEIGNLSFLKVINLAENQLIGSVPPSLFQLPGIFEVNFNENQLTYIMPSTFTEAAATLDSYLAANNSAYGTIPDDINQMQNLRVLILNDNNLNNASGQIPANLGFLPMIEDLNLKNNNFLGCWPATYKNLCDVLFVDFSGNDLINNSDFNAFCNTNIGICAGCRKEEHLGSVYVQDITFNADELIESRGGLLAGSKVFYNSGSQIQLSPGFFVSKDAALNANIQDCALTEEHFSCEAALPILPDFYYSTGPRSGNSCQNCSGGASHSVWYKYTPSSNGQIDISSCGGGANTRLWIYSGTCNNLVPVENSDDACEMGFGLPNYASQILGLQVSAGTTYFFEWDNRWSNDSFSFQLTSN